MIANTFLEGIQYLIDRKIDSAPFNKVKNGKIINRNSDGTYFVLLDNKEYRVEPLSSSILNIGDVVKILIPQNNYSEMFILNF